MPLRNWEGSSLRLSLSRETCLLFVQRKPRGIGRYVLHTVVRVLILLCTFAEICLWFISARVHFVLREYGH